MTSEQKRIYDLFIVGGGINGCGIARDAQGRGYSVALAERDDLASATSSASTKLFHGGLRYLEYFEFRLVREALVEREVLLTNMPHISWPMRFVLPLHSAMRFESTTPTSRLLTAIMPWMKGRRPAWLIRLGLFLYDHLGGRRILPGTRRIDLDKDPAGLPLDSRFTRAFEYSDCWVEDSRLVVLNARDAAARGASIMTRSTVVSAEPEDGLWRVTVDTPEGRRSMRARMLVNAAGPWVEDVARGRLHLNLTEKVRLVRGSHIVTRKLYDHDRAYFFQGTDGRIIFAIPYEEDFTLIGTTDAEHDGAAVKPVCSDSEADYLCAFASRYFRQPVTRADILWSYSGVRPLYDDGASSATAATRDYVLKSDRLNGTPYLNVFGGKITTYRKLAESALEKIDQGLSRATRPWTHAAPLAGGDFAVAERGALVAELEAMLPFMDAQTVRRLFRQYGTQCQAVFGGAASWADLGGEIAPGVSARELDWAAENEWVRTAQDFVWRRSKLGLRLSAADVAAIDRHLASRTVALESA
ncbi:glycerol-3-phosphate dehydrogenase [Zhengella mangrovi]|uniref:Glycerol-3-phosphate dehydrogenase n=1 Tax=Zhengella mangrovi TaxID=1982044 RepID=A0A2G1QTW7_9HYPH|nr:glycerol-3-phosphate dehydrogenase [Zhengella mangrovi]PHP68921.1 glycerol-3-phosphate dehydrogenase [Zhengella mangrovi]